MTCFCCQSAVNVWETALSLTQFHPSEGYCSTQWAVRCCFHADHGVCTHTRLTLTAQMMQDNGLTQAADSLSSVAQAPDTSALPFPVKPPVLHPLSGAGNHASHRISQASSHLLAQAFSKQEAIKGNELFLQQWKQWRAVLLFPRCVL